MTFHELNLLPPGELKQHLFNCCGSTAWVNKMLPFFPMEDLVELLVDAEEQWYSCKEEDWREAFARHPAIGDTASLEKNPGAAAQWAMAEQSGLNTASNETVCGMATGNDAYLRKFGYIFIVSATGKTAEELLASLQQRLTNSPEEEIKIAADEQNKITQIRLQKSIT
ncbi:MAG: 2-oxo-4-hydroxy-4-carboxy-5-ureidoimidazoline decarboxylase [Ferruginibacter sp.]